LKRKVLSWDLNACRDDVFFTWSGRLFHAVGPAIEKEQSPNFVEAKWLIVPHSLLHIYVLRINNFMPSLYLIGPEY